MKKKIAEIAAYITYGEIRRTLGLEKCLKMELPDDCETAVMVRPA